MRVFPQGKSKDSETLSLHWNLYKWNLKKNSSIQKATHLFSHNERKLANFSPQCTYKPPLDIIDNFIYKTIFPAFFSRYLFCGDVSLSWHHPRRMRGDAFFSSFLIHNKTSGRKNREQKTSSARSHSKERKWVKALKREKRFERYFSHGVSLGFFLKHFRRVPPIHMFYGDVRFYKKRNIIICVIMGLMRGTLLCLTW